MTLTARHQFVSTWPAGTNPAQIQPLRDWNDDHVFAGGSDGDLPVADSTQETGLTWQSKLILDPRDHGAFGNGTNDDTTAIQAALTAVPDGGAVRLRTGTYKITGSTALTCTGKSVELIFDPGAVLDVTGSTVAEGAAILVVSGSVGAYTLLGASPSAGARSLTVNASLAATLSEGDLIRLTTNPTYGGSGATWHSLGGTNYQGEMVEVLSVSGSVVALKNNLADSYTAANTVAARMAPIRVRIQNLTMRGTLASKQIAAQVAFVKDVVIDSGCLSGFGHTCLTLNYAFHGTVDRYCASNFWYAGVGNNYGVMIYSSQDVSVAGCSISGGRHAITTGGMEPNRRIHIGPNNTLDTDRAATEYAVFAHDNTDGFHVFWNQIRGGIAAANATRNNFHNNEITVASTSLGAINIAKDLAVNDDSLEVVNNRCTVEDGVASAVPLISVAGTSTTTKTLTSLILRGNRGFGQSAGLQVVQTSTGAFTITDADISQNTLVLTSTRRPVSISGFATGSRLTIGRLHLCDNRITGADTVLVNNFALTVTDYKARLNTLHHTGAGGSTPFLAKTFVGILRLYFDDNICQNDVAETQVELVATDYLRCTLNTLDGFSANGGLVLTATSILCRDNVTKNIVGSTSLTGTAIGVSFGPAGVASLTTVDGLVTAAS